MRAPVIKRLRMEAREASRLNRMARELGITEADVVLEALRLMEELRKQSLDLGLARVPRPPAAPGGPDDREFEF